jgi:hypothetical protein
MFGLRFLQISLLVPLHRQQHASARALPVRFEEVPALKHPSRKAPPEQWAAYRQAVKKTNLSTHAVTAIAALRSSLDEAGQQARRLLIVGDGSFCNRTLFTATLERTELIARARRDLKLCRKADGGQRSFYDKGKFTPEQVRQDESLPWRTTRVFHGGQWRELRYKEVAGIYWQSGAQKPSAAAIRGSADCVPGAGTQTEILPQSGLSAEYGSGRPVARVIAGIL